MLRDITLGQYMPGKTAVHKLDPRTKIILTILYIAMIFCVSSPIWYVLPFLYVLLAVRLSGLKPRHLLKSIKPLRFANYVGWATAVIGVLFALFTIIRKLLNPAIQSGWASTISIILLLGGVVIALLGIIGEYIGRIYLSINRYPQFVVRSVTRGGKVQEESETSLGA